MTKYRYKNLEGALRERIREIIRQTCAEVGVHVVKGVLARDHNRPKWLSLTDRMVDALQTPAGPLRNGGSTTTR
ncbi:transposase, partial [Hoeflea sp.]|uniref:transposase n=1 Tax=Hoeflea sp. TaxID=1940281 RepID=UPI0025C303C8